MCIRDRSVYIICTGRLQIRIDFGRSIRLGCAGSMQDAYPYLRGIVWLYILSSRQTPVSRACTQHTGVASTTLTSSAASVLKGLTGVAVYVRAIVRDSSLIYSIAPVVQLMAIHSPLQQAHFGRPDCSHHRCRRNKMAKGGNTDA